MIVIVVVVVVVAVIRDSGSTTFGSFFFSFNGGLLEVLRVNQIVAEGRNWTAEVSHEPRHGSSLALVALVCLVVNNGLFSLKVDVKQVN